MTDDLNEEGIADVGLTRLWKTTGRLSHDSWSPVLDKNLGLSEYKIGMLLTRSRISVDLFSTFYTYDTNQGTYE